MSDGHFPTLVSKDRNVNAVADPIWIEASDGAAALHKVTDVAAGANDSGIAALVVRDDALSTLTPAEGDYVPLRVSSTGALWVTLTTAGNTNIVIDDAAFTPGAGYVGAVGFFADENAPDSVDEGDIGIARMTLDRKQLMVLVDATNDAFRLAIDTNGKIGVSSMPTVTVSASALDIRTITKATDSIQISKDTAANASGNPIFVDISAQTLTAIKISKDANANSITNPIYVQNVQTGLQTTEIHSWDTTVDVASDTPDNHDYAVAGTTFLLKSVIFAASGGLKVEVLTGPVGSLVQIATAFIPKEGGFGQIFFDPPREVPVASTGTVRVIRTNRQGQVQDVYSTIIGNDLP